MDEQLAKQEQSQKQWRPLAQRWQHLPKKRRGVFLSIIFAFLAALLLIPVAAFAHASQFGIGGVNVKPATTGSPVPAGFVQTQLAHGMKDPIVFVFAPNGDIYIGTQQGSIFIYRNGTLLPTPLGTIPALGQNETGLLGMALDPNYATNGYVYISYTTQSDYARLSRFTVVSGALSLASEKIYYTGNQLQNPHHSGNDLHIGPDGKLWWSVGDNVPTITNAQTLTNAYGKMLRFNLDGSAPSDNPFLNVPGAVPYIYAYGLRNPWRFTFLPNGKAMTEDTGSNFWEDLNIIQPGANYGWPLYEGEKYSTGYVNPAYAYGHIPTDGAASAIAAYSGTAFPNQYNHVVFFGDYNRTDIEAVTFDSSYSHELSDNVFSNAAGTIADLQEGPDGSLYFVSIFEGTFSKISAVGPFPPTAAISANKTAGTAPLTVQFSSVGSSDPYGKTLTYSWNFGDGSPVDTTANPSHIYTTNGTYTATLTVSNGSQTGTATTQIVVGHTPPTVSLTSPAVNTTYNGGATVSFSGTATDAVDGTEPASAYSWQVDFYAGGNPIPFYTDEVAHPFYTVNGVTSGSFQIPQDLSNTATTLYRITLTVTNSLGIKTIVTRDIHPNTTSWSVSANIAGAGYMVDGTWHKTPYSTQDGVGIEHTLSGFPMLQTVSGVKYRFKGWSDGSALVDAFTTSATAGSYTAIYEPVSSTMPTGWNSTDIGNPLFVGRADYASSSQSFYVDGAGADAFGTTEQFHYVYRALPANGTIVARVRYQTGASSPWAKAGLMIMQSATSGSTFVDVLTTPTESPNTPNVNCIGYTVNGCDAPLPPVTPAEGYGLRMQYTSSGSKSATPTGYNSPNEWLKLQRVGTSFSSWYSVDGVHWTLIGTVTVNITGSAVIGLFVCSHNINQPSTVAFDNVSIA